MNIASIDSNLKIESTLNEPDITWLDVRTEPFAVYGLYDYRNVELFRRMPENVAASVSDAVKELHADTAGGRVRFKTDSPYIAIKAEIPHGFAFSHMPLTGTAGFDLSRYDHGTCRMISAFTPPADVFTKKGYESLLRVDTFGENPGNPDMQEYLINFPLYSYVKNLYIGLHRDCRLDAGSPYENEKPVVFYGSSITQGACASVPGNSYQGFLARKFNMNYVNLGFSGSAKAEPEMIEYLSGLDMLAFVSDYDHNAPTVEHLKATHSPLYEAIRAKHPHMPYLFVSRPNTDHYPRDSAARREVVYATYQAAVEKGDENVYFVDGQKLFEEDDRCACTVDSCHPNDLGFYRMSKAIAPFIAKVLNKD